MSFKTFKGRADTAKELNERLGEGDVWRRSYAEDVPEILERVTEVEGALRDLTEAVGWMDYFAVVDGNDLENIILERFAKAKVVLEGGGE